MKDEVKEEFEFKVQLKQVKRPPKPTPDADLSKESRPPVVRTLILAHQIEDLVRSGRASDYTEAGRQLGLTGARVSQIVGVTLLSPRIQETILNLPVGYDLAERNLRSLAMSISWVEQGHGWSTIPRASKGGSGKE